MNLLSARIQLTVTERYIQFPRCRSSSNRSLYAKVTSLVENCMSTQFSTSRSRVSLMTLAYLTRSPHSRYLQTILMSVDYAQSCSCASSTHKQLFSSSNFSPYPHSNSQTHSKCPVTNSYCKVLSLCTSPSFFTDFLLSNIPASVKCKADLSQEPYRFSYCLQETNWPVGCVKSSILSKVNLDFLSKNPQQSLICEFIVLVLRVSYFSFGWFAFGCIFFRKGQSFVRVRC